MIDEVVAIVLGVVPVVLRIVTLAVGDATQYWCLRIGFIGNARGLVGVSGAVGRSIASEDAIRSGMSASYANLSQNGYGYAIRNALFPIFLSGGFSKPTSCTIR